MRIADRLRAILNMLNTYPLNVAAGYDITTAGSAFASKHRRLLSVRQSDAIALLLVFVIQIGGYLAHQQLVGSINPPRRVSSPAAGMMMAAMLVAQSVTLVCVYKLWCRLPDRVRRVLYRFGIGLAVVTIAIYATINQYWLVVGGLIGVVIGYLIHRILSGKNYYKWLGHNAIAVALGVASVGFLTMGIEPAVVLTLLVGTMLWDLYAVNDSDWMEDIVDLSVGGGVPNYVILADGLRVDYAHLREHMRDLDGVEKPENVGGIIGLGDYILPALLATTAAVSSSISTLGPAVGAMLGTVGAMLKLQMDIRDRESAVPALPWLNTGAIVGYMAGILLTGTPVVVALGVAGG